MLAFAHIQKTAGITINWILRRSFGLRHCEVEPWRPFAGRRYYAAVYSAEDHVRVQRLYPRLGSIAGHHVKPFSDLHEVRPDVRYFTFLREPLERTASHYQHGVQQMGYPHSCEHWLEDERFHNLQTKHIAGTDDVDEAIRILRERCVCVGLTERFDESLVLLRQRREDPRLDVRYRSANVAGDSTLRRRLLAEPRTRELLGRVNDKDLALYDYVRHELYPLQQREFGPGLERAVEAYRASNRVRQQNPNAFASRAMRVLVLDPLARRARRHTAADRGSPPAPAGESGSRKAS